jgi:putative copper resistance protein D
MVQYVDLLLRGLALVGSSVALGGVAWVMLILTTGPLRKPDPPAVHALRVAGSSALVVAAAQVAIMLSALAALSQSLGHWPLRESLETVFAWTGIVRSALGGLIAVLAFRLARHPAGRLSWTALAGAATLLVSTAALVSHAAARIDHRPLLLTLDVAHQLAAAAWLGGLVHLLVYGMRGHAEVNPGLAILLRRFSALASGAVTVLALTGLALSVLYVREPAALIGTAYGVMVLSKVILFGGALALGAANLVGVRREPLPALRLGRLVEVEVGLGVTVLLVAASLTSLPPAVDVEADRASLSEVAGRFAPALPRLQSPPLDELLRVADPLMGPPGERKAIERAWSEYNHHWAGLFVLLLGLGAVADRLGVRAARHWPLALLGLAVFLFVRSDPRAWPLGPAGFWESLTLPDVLQHRFFVVLVVALALFEWSARTGRVRPRPWAHVFPILCAVGGGLLLTHSHAMVNLKDEFLTEVTHVPLGVLGVFVGWASWVELRLPEVAAPAGWIWRVCLVAIGLLLVLYREG